MRGFFFVLALTAASVPAHAQALPWSGPAMPEVRTPPPALKPFETLGYPAPFTRARFETMLQIVVDRVYLKGFRHLGMEEDFFHGHILSFDGRQVAILYHTQERANYYEGTPASASFGYLDRQTRNWLQWLDDPARVENARAYERAEYPADADISSSAVGLYREHFTIDPRMLEPRLMGGKLTAEEQWSFYRVACQNPSPPYAEDSNLMAITLPTHETVCLEIMTTSK